MSNRDNEKDYSDLTNALQFVFSQFIKDIYVSIPGIIQSYDSASKRCRVLPAINVRKTDGTSFAQSEVVNVPVLWPGGGGFVLLSPLQNGDAVEIKFSQRGITKFKEGFVQADPDNGMFEKEDAHVIPGYGAFEVTPATEDGISIQSDDGANYIFVEDGAIEINSNGDIGINSTGDIKLTAAGDIELTAATEISLTAPTVTVSNDIEMTAGVITGPAVFNGPDSDIHAHEQESDGSGDSEQKTNGPS